MATKKSLFDNHSIYPYGKPVKEPIKFVFDKKEKVLFAFKRSNFEKFMSQKEEKMSAEIPNEVHEGNNKEQIFEEENH
jgi:hypothetical protein